MKTRLLLATVSLVAPKRTMFAAIAAAAMATTFVPSEAKALCIGWAGFGIGDCGPVGGTRQPAAPAPTPAPAVVAAPVPAPALANSGANPLVGNDGSSFKANPLVGNDGSSFKANPLVGNDGSSLKANSLVGNDGSSVISNDGGSIITHDGGSLISHDGGTLVGNDGSSALSKIANGLVSSGGGNARSLLDLNPDQQLNTALTKNLTSADSQAAKSLLADVKAGKVLDLASQTKLASLLNKADPNAYASLAFSVVTPAQIAVNAAKSIRDGLVSDLNAATAQEPIVLKQIADDKTMTAAAKAQATQAAIALMATSIGQLQANIVGANTDLAAKVTALSNPGATPTAKNTPAQAPAQTAAPAVTNIPAPSPALVAVQNASNDLINLNTKLVGDAQFLAKTLAANGANDPTGTVQQLQKQLNADTAAIATSFGILDAKQKAIPPTDQASLAAAVGIIGKTTDQTSKTIDSVGVILTNAVGAAKAAAKAAATAPSAAQQATTAAATAAAAANIAAAQVVASAAQAAAKTADQAYSDATKGVIRPTDPVVLVGGDLKGVTKAVDDAVSAAKTSQALLAAVNAGDPNGVAAAAYGVKGRPLNANEIAIVRDDAAKNSKAAFYQQDLAASGFQEKIGRAISADNDVTSAKSAEDSLKAAASKTTDPAQLATLNAAIASADLVQKAAQAKSDQLHADAAIATLQTTNRDGNNVTDAQKAQNQAEITRLQGVSAAGTAALATLVQATSDKSNPANASIASIAANNYSGLKEGDFHYPAPKSLPDGKPNPAYDPTDTIKQTSGGHVQASIATTLVNSVVAPAAKQLADMATAGALAASTNLTNAQKLGAGGATTATVPGIDLTSTFAALHAVGNLKPGGTTQVVGGIAAPSLPTNAVVSSNTQNPASGGAPSTTASPTSLAAPAGPAPLTGPPSAALVTSFEAAVRANVFGANVAGSTMAEKLVAGKVSAETMQEFLSMTSGGKAMSTAAFAEFQNAKANIDTATAQAAAALGVKPAAPVAVATAPAGPTPVVAAGAPAAGAPAPVVAAGAPAAGAPAPTAAAGAAGAVAPVAVATTSPAPGNETKSNTELLLTRGNERVTGGEVVIQPALPLTSIAKDHQAKIEIWLSKIPGNTPVGNEKAVFDNVSRLLAKGASTGLDAGEVAKLQEGFDKLMAKQTSGAKRQELTALIGAAIPVKATTTPVAGVPVTPAVAGAASPAGSVTPAALRGNDTKAIAGGDARIRPMSGTPTLEKPDQKIPATTPPAAATKPAASSLAVATPNGPAAGEHKEKAHTVPQEKLMRSGDHEAKSAVMHPGGDSRPQSALQKSAPITAPKVAPAVARAPAPPVMAPAAPAPGHK